MYSYETGRTIWIGRYFLKIFLGGVSAMSILVNTKQDIKNFSPDKIQFELTVTHIDDLEQMRYTTYGIRAIDSNGEVAASYPDLSTSKRHVQEFLDKLANHDVSAMHIADLIEDFLN